MQRIIWAIQVWWQTTRRCYVNSLVTWQAVNMGRHRAWHISFAQSHITGATADNAACSKTKKNPHIWVLLTILFHSLWKQEVSGTLKQSSSQRTSERKSPRSTQSHSRHNSCFNGFPSQSREAMPWRFGTHSQMKIIVQTSESHSIEHLT